MKFDPKKIIDSTLDQMSESSRRQDERGRRSYGHEGDVEDLIHRITRDVEEIRMKNRDLNSRIDDLERNINHLRELMRDKKY